MGGCGDCMLRGFVGLLEGEQIIATIGALELMKIA